MHVDIFTHGYKVYIHAFTKIGHAHTGTYTRYTQAYKGIEIDTHTSKSGKANAPPTSITNECTRANFEPPFSPRQDTPQRS